MSKSDFDAFVKRQQAEQKAAEAAVNPEQRLKEWLDYLDALYKQITGYLQSYIDSNAASVECRPVQLNEEFIGPYPVRQMILKIGRATITFAPIGTMLVAAKGRVDVQGPSGKATLLLVNKLATSSRSLIQVTIRSAGDPPPSPPSAEAVKQIEWAWKIGTPPPEVNFIELTQRSFFDMILEVANA